MANVYNIKGLDCASCGSKIEDAIKKLPGVSYAVVDFANLRLHLEAIDLNRVRNEIMRIDPAVEVLPVEYSSVKTQSQEDVFGSENAKSALLSRPCSFLAVHAYFEERFHESDWVVLDYGLALAAYFLAGINVYVSAFRTFRRGDFFDENVLMVVATRWSHRHSQPVGSRGRDDLFQSRRVPAKFGGCTFTPIDPCAPCVQTRFGEFGNSRRSSPGAAGAGSGRGDYFGQTRRESAARWRSRDGAIQPGCLGPDRGVRPLRAPESGIF